jgi:hypothetical protein
VGVTLLVEHLHPPRTLRVLHRSIVPSHSHGDQPPATVHVCAPPSHARVCPVTHVVDGAQSHGDQVPSAVHRCTLRMPSLHRQIARASGSQSRGAPHAATSNESRASAATRRGGASSAHLGRVPWTGKRVGRT